MFAVLKVAQFCFYHEHGPMGHFSAFIAGLTEGKSTVFRSKDFESLRTKCGAAFYEAWGYGFTILTLDSWLRFLSRKSRWSVGYLLFLIVIGFFVASSVSFLNLTWAGLPLPIRNLNIPISSSNVLLSALLLIAIHFWCFLLTLVQFLTNVFPQFVT